MNISRVANEAGLSRTMVHRYLKAGVPIENIGVDRPTNRERLIHALEVSGLKDRLSLDLDTHRVYLDGRPLDGGRGSIARVFSLFVKGDNPFNGTGLRVTMLTLLCAMLSDDRFKRFRSTREAVLRLKWDGVKRLDGCASMFFGPGNDGNDDFFKHLFS